jgi:AcrR family transcriptional regulator
MVEEQARTARREATRQRVLDAARDVFAERGVIGASVEDICAAAGFTRGAFYSNFVDKTDVARALLAREYERTLTQLDESFQLPDGATGSGQVVDPLEAIASVVARLLPSAPPDRKLLLAQTEFELSAIRNPAIAEAYRVTSEGGRRRVADFIVRGMDRLGRELIVDPIDAADAVVSLLERSSRRALLEGGGADPDALAMAIVPPLMVALSRDRRSPTASAPPTGD